MIRFCRRLIQMPVVLLVLAWLGGCASHEALPTYYVLTPPAAAGPTTARIHGTRVFIRRVTIPGYLQTTKLASRLADSEIDYSPTARWAEPLAEGISHALADALSRQPEIGSVSTPPLAVPLARDFDLAINIESFEGDEHNEVILAVRWQLYRQESAAPLVSRQYRFVQTGWTYGDEAGEARLLAGALQELGVQIGQAVRR
jgi:uncharacterized lipoprotein YmbA